MIDVRDAGPVRILTLASGKVNALDVEILIDLCDALRAAEQSGQRAVVLTGAGAVFSAGVDLRRVVDGGSAYTDRLIPALSAAFLDLFRFPAPTVAAINGAAIAGGCVLACACDRRLIAPDAPIGASELRVGVPFPAAALEILRHACGDHAEDVILDGKLHRGGEALARRLAHTVVDGDVLGAAVAVAAELTAIPAGVYGHTKARLRAPALARAEAVDDDEVRATWGSDRTRDAIAAHMERLRDQGRS
jgi:enoyl-CoA hydratase/carnithine racemase